MHSPDRPSVRTEAEFGEGAGRGVSEAGLRVGTWEVRSESTEMGHQDTERVTGAHTPTEGLGTEGAGYDTPGMEGPKGRGRTKDDTASAGQSDQALGAVPLQPVGWVAPAGRSVARHSRRCVVIVVAHLAVAASPAGSPSPHTTGRPGCMASTDRAW